MSDLFGHAAPGVEFQDIRNQRPSVAEEKATLCRHLNELLRRTPRAEAIATINQTHAYSHAHKQCLKVLRASSSSRSELQRAIDVMSPFFA